MRHTFTFRGSGVHRLTAPYALLCKAFGDDGTVTERDTLKSMAQWDVDTPHGVVEIYDYGVGKCYQPGGLERNQITEWNVQGGADAIGYMLWLLDCYFGHPTPS